MSMSSKTQHCLRMEKHDDYRVFLIAVDYQEVSVEYGRVVGDLLHNIESLISNRDCKDHQCT